MAELKATLNRRMDMCRTNLVKKVYGVPVRFTITHQFRCGVLPSKIINVTDGVGFGPVNDWSDALALAREFAANTSDWHLRQRARTPITPEL